MSPSNFVADYKLIAATVAEKDSCSSLDCGKEILPGATLWIDRLSTNAYCDGCGKSLQYRRDKAVQRGEVAPVTFEDAEARWQSAMQKR